MLTYMASRSQALRFRKPRQNAQGRCPDYFRRSDVQAWLLKRAKRSNSEACTSSAPDQRQRESCCAGLKTGGRRPADPMEANHEAADIDVSVLSKSLRMIRQKLAVMESSVMSGGGSQSKSSTLRSRDELIIALHDVRT